MANVNYLPLTEYVAVYTGQVPVIFIPRAAVMHGHCVVCNWQGTAHRTAWYLGEGNQLESWWVPVADGDILRGEGPDDRQRVFLRGQPTPFVGANALPKTPPVVPVVVGKGPPAPRPAIPRAAAPKAAVVPARGVIMPKGPPAAMIPAPAMVRPKAPKAPPPAAVGPPKAAVPKRALSADSGMPAMKRPSRR